jgi:hypothetical protein
MSIAALIPIFDTRWRLVVNFSARPLYLGERTPCTYCTGGWVVLRAGLDYSIREKSLTLTGFEPRTMELVA